VGIYLKFIVGGVVECEMTYLKAAAARPIPPSVLT